MPSSPEIGTAKSPIPVLDITKEKDQKEENQELVERRLLTSNQDSEYEESLRTDQEKERIREEEENESRRLEQLRLTRLSRIEPEVTLQDEHVVIAVRHPDL